MKPRSFAGGDGGSGAAEGRTVDGGFAPNQLSARNSSGAHAREGIDLRRARRALSVMLIDADAVDAKYIRWLLESMGRYEVQVVVAPSVGEARRLSATRDFDVYLSDFWLNQETSIAFIREIAVRQPKAAILLLTSLGSEDIEELGLRAGAHGFLTKFELSEKALELGISACLSRSEALHAMRQRIRLVEQRYDGVLGTAAAERLGFLARLDDLCQLAKVGAGEGARDILQDLAGSLAELRRDLLDGLSGEGHGDRAKPAVGEPVQAEFDFLRDIETERAGPEAEGEETCGQAVSQSGTDLRDIVAEAVDFYGFEAQLKGVDVSAVGAEQEVLVGGDRLIWVAALVGILEWVASMCPTAITLWSHPARDGIPATVRILGRAVAAGGDVEDGVLAWPSQLFLPLGATHACERSSDGSVAVVLGLPNSPVS
ncbi:response regulator [Breoghania sp.]|uniref:response regulator n=1 Tax=Breoghania sp. TaxID=2065378 RepID=UPI002AAA8A16|nr:response regulator [Breoghania sp.]